MRFLFLAIVLYTAVGTGCESWVMGESDSLFKKLLTLEQAMVDPAWTQIGDVDQLGEYLQGYSLELAPSFREEISGESGETLLRKLTLELFRTLQREYAKALEAFLNARIPDTSVQVQFDEKQWVFTYRPAFHIKGTLKGAPLAHLTMLVVPSFTLQGARSKALEEHIAFVSMHLTLRQWGNHGIPFGPGLSVWGRYFGALAYPPTEFFDITRVPSSEVGKIPAQLREIELRLEESNLDLELAKMIVTPWGGVVVADFTKRVVRGAANHGWNEAAGQVLLKLRARLFPESQRQVLDSGPEALRIQLGELHQRYLRYALDYRLALALYAYFRGEGVFAVERDSHVRLTTHALKAQLGYPREHQLFSLRHVLNQQEQENKLPLIGELSPRSPTWFELEGFFASYLHNAEIPFSALSKELKKTITRLSLILHDMEVLIDAYEIILAEGREKLGKNRTRLLMIQTRDGRRRSLYSPLPPLASLVQEETEQQLQSLLREAGTSLPANSALRNFFEFYEAALNRVSLASPPYFMALVNELYEAQRPPL